MNKEIKNMRVIICGGRDYRLTEADKEKLTSFHRVYNFTKILSGGCVGADFGGEAWAKSQGIPVEQYIPDWVAHGNKAGPLRNQEMANNADACIAFPGGKGTLDMIRRAEKKGLKMFLFKEW